jgi:hypothetical protein
MFEYYSNKQFVLVTSLENLDKEINQPNCKIITMGGDVTNQINEFKRYIPCSTKKTFGNQTISLNRGHRNHRTYLVSLLYGNHLDKYTSISYLGLQNTKHTELKNTLNYDYKSDQNYNLANTGFLRFVTAPKNYDNEEIYINTTANDNVYNFTSTLAQ